MKFYFEKLKKKYGVIVSIVQVVVILSIVLMIICPVSCKVTEEGVSIVEGDYTSPKIESFSVLDSRNIRISFSKDITMKNVSLSPFIEINNIDYMSSNDTNSICFSDICLLSSLEVGQEYSFYGEVFDKSGNSLTFCYPFCGYNSEIPKIEITEIRPMYKGETNGNGKFICEYVELHVILGGNLSGLELFSLNDGENKSYKFPSIKVYDNEIIVVHLRSKGEGCINELESDLNLSYALCSAVDSRDLWSDNDESRLNDKSDIVVLRNSSNGSFLDVVPYSKSEVLEWKNESFVNCIEDAIRQELWASDSLISSAVNADGITSTKSLLKIKSGKDACCWQVSTTNGGTPGTI